MQANEATASMLGARSWLREDDTVTDRYTPSLLFDLMSIQSDQASCDYTPKQLSRACLSNDPCALRP